MNQVNKLKNINYTRVWNLAWPIILANVSIPMIGATNIAVLGHLPDSNFIAAVAIGVVALQCIYWGFSFLRKVTTGVTAQAFGAGKDTELILILIRNLLIAFIFGILTTALQYPISKITFALIDSSPEIEVLAQKYFNIRIWATTAVLGNYVMLGWLYGIQRPKLALILRVGMNLLNITLAIFFVSNLSLNIEGVAYAALISQVSFFFISLFFTIYMLKNKLHRIFNNRFISVLIHEVKIKQIFSFNNDIFVRTILVFIAFSWFTAQGAKQGDTVLASNAVLLNLFWFISYALDGFSNAAEALVGESIGSKCTSSLKKCIKISTKFAFVFASLFTLSYFLFGKNIIDLLTNIEAIRNESLIYLPWLIALPLVSIWCFQLDGIFLGATKTRIMRNMMILSFFAYAFSIVTFPKLFNNHGLWLSMHVFMIVRAISLYLNMHKVEVPSKR